MKMKAHFAILPVLFAILIGAEKLPVYATGEAVAQDPARLFSPSAVVSGEGLGITYQGWLSKDDQPADGAYDFEFKLLDAGKALVGPGVTVENLQVSGGVFTALLDFGERAFTGERRFLRVGVRPGDSVGAYTTLSPDQEITAAPLALSIPGLYTLASAASPSLIGGYPGNRIPAGTVGAAISGGGDAESPNHATDNYASVGGGAGNQAGDDLPDPASAAYASVAGGLSNQAKARFAAIGGGEGNMVNGAYGTIPGGTGNRVEAEYGVAVGRNAWVKADDKGAILLAANNSSDIVFYSEEENEFAVWAPGGIRLFTGTGVDGSPIPGCSLLAGSSSWACTSDRNAKKDFAAVDGREVLEKLAQVPVTTWSFKTQEGGVRHMGPVAQDFYVAFKLGEGERTISSVDTDGVAIAAIQGLHQIAKEQAAQIQGQQERIEALERRLAALEKHKAAPDVSRQRIVKMEWLLALGLGALAALCACTLVQMRRLRGLMNAQAGRRPQA